MQVVAMFCLCLLVTPADVLKANPSSDYVCRKDAAAYSHALRECKIMASNRRVYHALGCAKGARFCGVGMSYSSKPRHCYSKTDERRLIARAFVKTASGATYWSAHYK